ncbi:AAA domain-containing protein [Desarmillaria tabescens]|uniref:AAA domain-containing protein n=1 Tax=Armillaria tabescens TaxID=1929756 RepID=A0AA39K2B1_ARMTA|nr:AAA domain-containing protein [Desarmillaria tabescens]KAK0452145.1 AAA domain-containing protein [Desarmillaria tabescens]
MTTKDFNQDSCTRIYAVGPSSTGKSTLCTALAKKLDLHGPAYITEVARTVIKERGFTKAHIGLLEMQEAIMDAQIDRERETRGSYPVQVFDRSAVDPIVYAVLTGASDLDGKERSESLSKKDNFQETLAEYMKLSSIFFLLAPVEEWLVDDGTRHLDNGKECFGIFERVLSGLGISYSVIGENVKDLNDRVSLVLDRARLQ